MRTTGAAGGVVVHIHTSICVRVAEEERLYARECVPASGTGEGRAGSSAWTSCVYRTYVLLPLRTTQADGGVLEVGALRHEEENATEVEEAGGRGG